MALVKRNIFDKKHYTVSFGKSSILWPTRLIQAIFFEQAMLYLDPPIYVMKTAILIDDDRDDLEFLEEAIKQVDNSVKCISYLYCDDAIKKIVKESTAAPNYIFIDMNMPRLNGTQCLKELRSDPKLKNVPIAILSTSMPVTLARSLRENGANFTFQKPNKFEDYEHLLKPIMGSPYG